jgi:hypothetical protein
MRKLPPLKIKIFWVILALLTASIACESPDLVAPVVESIAEECYPVDRGIYEYTAATLLRQTPKTPKYPEGAIYEVCRVNGEISSVRMTNGPRPEEPEVIEQEEPEVTESEEANSLSPSTGADESNSTSTDHYIGSSNYPDVIGFSSGQYPKNEISIRVADDGTVSGSYLMSYIGDPSTYDLDEGACTEQWDMDINGTFSGKLTGSQGTIKLVEDWVCTANSYCWDDVDPNSCPMDEPFSREFEILINDDTMSGTTVPWPGDDPFMWEFSAVKQ